MPGGRVRPADERRRRIGAEKFQQKPQAQQNLDDPEDDID